MLKGSRQVKRAGRGMDEESKRFMDIQMTDKATKRILAPFVRIVPKYQKLLEEEEDKKLSYLVKRKPSVLLRDLSSFLSDSVDLISIVHETTVVLKNVTRAAGVTLYMMDSAAHEIYQSTIPAISARHQVRWKIREKSTVAAHVAYKLEYVMVDDLIQDNRFPEGIGYQTFDVKAVLCIPVVTPSRECFAVIELVKLLNDKSFTQDDLKIALIVTGWMGAAVHENSRRLGLQRQQELNDYLLEVTTCCFEGSISADKMITEVVKFAKITLKSERASVFIIDGGNECAEDLVADLYEDHYDGIAKRSQKVRFGKDKGITGHVAMTGSTINIRDTYKDTKYGRSEIDQRTGFITRSILCMPIEGADGVMGVIQVMNKLPAGGFERIDEALLKTFSTYCAIALRFSKVKKQLLENKRFRNCYSKIVQLQMGPCQHDMDSFKNGTKVLVPISFDQYSWYIEEGDQWKMPQLGLYMFLQIFKPHELLIDKTVKYILTIRKFYRNNPFHNFEHAFNVLHCMHLILKRNAIKFTEIEVKGLFLAALSHDLDHYGVTNTFLETINDDLAQLYQTSILENHHYRCAMFILENINIFGKIDEEVLIEIKNEMRSAIIATDLLVYFVNKMKLQKICSRNSFNWENEKHRTLLKGIMMTSCDLSGNCKPFLVAKKIVDNLYVEFYRQGDLEKKMGLCPLSTMDRSQTNIIPEDQVKFMNIIVLPCVELLKTLLPNTEALFNEALLLKQTWEDIIKVRNTKCWRQDDSILELQNKF